MVALGPKQTIVLPPGYHYRCSSRGGGGGGGVTRIDLFDLVDLLDPGTALRWLLG